MILFLSSSFSLKLFPLILLNIWFSTTAYLCSSPRQTSPVTAQFESLATPETKPKFSRKWDTVIMKGSESKKDHLGNHPLRVMESSMLSGVFHHVKYGGVRGRHFRGKTAVDPVFKFKLGSKEPSD